MRFVGLVILCTFGAAQGLCSNDLQGVENAGVCCLEACGECGGSGCNSREGGRENCCRGTIEESGVLCSASGMAPCIVDDVVDGTLCDNEIPGIQGVGVCCSRECGTCGGPNCNGRPGGANECCRSAIVLNGTPCELSGSAPCVFTEVEETFCDGEIPGIERDGACCSRQCGRCGGAGCDGLPGGEFECCRRSIIAYGNPCTEYDAPCFLDDGEESLCDGDIPGVQGDGVCCSDYCGTCGGDGCDLRPGGSDECCRGNIIDNGALCGEFDAPCVLVGSA